MRGLGNSVSRLSAMNRARAFPPPERGDGRLAPLTAFGSNPGALDAFAFVPDGLEPGAPLVVVLHGCTQNAASYDRGSGWSRLAERHGFALLVPEQRRANNPNLCFNWFSPPDARRGSGEALSIRQMVAKMVKLHQLDEARIFVTGLSAGGAMTSVMLAAYPEVFAGGAVIAGLPFATANTVPEALDRMRGHGGPANDKLARLVTGASDHRGPWPTLSVWHGTSDATVDLVNADAIVDQWRSLHGLGEDPGRVDIIDGYPREVWIDAGGREVIEKYEISGMGHGTPLDPRGGEQCGTAGPYMLDAQICSTSHIARFWGISGSPGDRNPARAEAKPSARAPDRARADPSKGGVGKVIEDALRAAGLMR